MSRILNNKKALATVVTTLIILVVAVLLATVLTFYAINVTSNRTQQESLYMANLHVWYNTTGAGWAEAAFAITNTGGRDAVLQSITARSQQTSWTNVYYNSSNTWTVNSLSPSNLPLGKVANATNTNIATVSGTFGTSAATKVVLNQATNVVTLKSGYTLVVYIMHPDSIGQNDVGTPCAVTVFTANAQWTQETNVQASQ